MGASTAGFWGRPVRPGRVTRVDSALRQVRIFSSRVPEPGKVNESKRSDTYRRLAGGGTVGITRQHFSADWNKVGHWTRSEPIGGERRLFERADQ